MTFTTYLWIVSGLLFVWAVYIEVKRIIAMVDEEELKRKYGEAFLKDLRARKEAERRLKIMKEADNELKKQ